MRTDDLNVGGAVHFPRLRNLRQDADKTQRNYRHSGIDQRVYSNYETGKREIPVRCLMALADYYGTTLDYLTGRTKEGCPR